MSRPFIIYSGVLSAIAALCWQVPSARAEQGWGTIKGRAVYSGNEAPPIKNVDVNKDQAPCLSKGPIPSEDLVVNKQNKGVEWVFVWLTPKKGQPPLPIHPLLATIKQKTVSIDQPCCRFEPHALGLREGQDLLAKNSGIVAHNVHWTGHPLKNPGGNVIVPAGKSYLITDLKADDFPVKISCDIHGWMSAWVMVFNHPYFAITDADGNFEIQNAPAGTYQLRSRSDQGYGPGQRTGIPVTIKPNEVTDVGVIEYPPRRLK
jgi:hypothetical protein